MIRRFLTIPALFVLTSCLGGKQADSKTKVPESKVDTIHYFDFHFSKVHVFLAANPYELRHVTTTGIMQMSDIHDTINRVLNSSQIKYLGEVLSGKLNKDTSTVIREADCFNPRHNIIFLDEKDSLVHYISVCFECNRVKASKYGKASMANYADFFNSIGLKVFERPDEFAAFYDSLKKSGSRR